MTTPSPSTAPPAPPTPGRLVTSSFGSALTPPQVTALLNAVIDAAPFSGSLTRAETATGKLAFPVSQPSGYAWLRELEQVPRLVLDDRSTVVSVCKLAGYIPVSAELLADAAVNVTNWVSSALTGSLSADLDRGILLGSGEPEPDGVLDQVDAVPGATLTEAAGAALAAIGECGGQPDVIALSPTAFVAELTDVDATGRLVHPGGLPDFLGLRCVQVPALPAPLVFDSRLCFLVLGSDPQVTVHDDWQHDAQVLLVKARANVGIPVKDRAIRKLAIGDGGGGNGGDGGESAPAAGARAPAPKGKR